MIKASSRLDLTGAPKAKRQGENAATSPGPLQNEDHKLERLRLKKNKKIKGGGGLLVNWK